MNMLYTLCQPTAVLSAKDIVQCCINVYALRICGISKSYIFFKERNIDILPIPQNSFSFILQLS